MLIGCIEYVIGYLLRILYYFLNLICVGVYAQKCEEKLFASQTQVQQLQLELQRLQRGFEAFVRAHTAQEEELKQTKETAATLKQRLRDACEEVRRHHNTERGS